MGAKLLDIRRWGTMVIGRPSYQQGTDGRTAFQRQIGRQCKNEVVPFGEKVMYKESMKSGERKRAIESKWQFSIWLGHAPASNGCVVGTESGEVRAYTFKRLTESQ